MPSYLDLEYFAAINEEFFQEQNMGTMKNSGSNKQLQIIVCFVFNVLQFLCSKDTTT